MPLQGSTRSRYRSSPRDRGCKSPASVAASPTKSSSSRDSGTISAPTGHEVHVRAFFDSNNDGIGDFAGLTQKLPCLQDPSWSSTTPPIPAGALGTTGHEVGRRRRVGRLRRPVLEAAAEDDRHVGVSNDDGADRADRIRAGREHLAALVVQRQPADTEVDGDGAGGQAVVEDHEGGAVRDEGAHLQHEVLLYKGWRPGLGAD